MGLNKGQTNNTSFKKGQLAWNNTNTYITCQTCGEKKKVKPAYKRNGCKFCSWSCYSKSKLGSLGYWRGKKRPDMTDWNINNPNQIFKDTKPELQMEELLKRLDVDYQKQVPLFNTARVDFYVQSKNLVIQVDGCYWHGCPIHFPNSHQDKKERDIRQDKILQENGLTVIRFWEHEIMSPNFLIKDLINN